MAPTKSRSSVKRRLESFLDGPSVSATSELSSHSHKKRRASGPPPSRTQQAGSKSQPLLVSSENESSHSTPTKNGKRSNKETAEKRLRRFRTHPPGTFMQKLARARTQRMIVLSRTKTSPISEDIDIVGSTGNIYTVTIGHLPSCTCPDHGKGNECKHKVYALLTVLRAPEHLVYQLALLTNELEQIFHNAPPIPTDVVVSDADDNNDKNHHHHHHHQHSLASSTSTNRKPIKDEGSECPICYMDMTPSREEIVWCQALCGNNMHKSCFQQWAATSRHSGQVVTCVYCRTPWQDDVGLTEDLVQRTQKQQQQQQQHQEGPAINQEGYVNVAHQFGMSRVRDYSSYNQPWVRRTLLGNGY